MGDPNYLLSGVALQVTGQFKDCGCPFRNIQYNFFCPKMDGEIHQRDWSL